jgi:hypothetical protein
MRLRDLLPRVATLPLGSGALAGNPFLVDRQFLAKVRPGVAGGGRVAQGRNVPFFVLTLLSARMCALN